MAYHQYTQFLPDALQKQYNYDPAKVAAKLRLDLFERRYKIYDATMRFVANIVGKATFEDADLVEFYRQTSDAVFFFRNDVVEYLGVIRDRAVKMRRARVNRMIWWLGSDYWIIGKDGRIEEVAERS